MEKVYIIEAKRTAIGSFLGSLTNTHPADMGVALVKVRILLKLLWLYDNERSI